MSDTKTTVREIVKSWLEEQDFHGLRCTEEQCHCGIEKLMPCVVDDFVMDDCAAMRLIECPEKNTGRIHNCCSGDCTNCSGVVFE